MQKEKINRKHKDRLFRLMFGDEKYKKNLLELYNALNGSAYTDVEMLEINTIEDVIYMKMKNDVSFILDSVMSLYEQQSTYSPNLPFRSFEYSAKLYNKYMAGKEEQLYGKTLVSLPAPQCYVLYNGTDFKEARKVMKLSDAFEVSAEGYEWTTTLININPGYNDDILEKCEMLKSYSYFIAAIRENAQKNPDKTKDEVVDFTVTQFQDMDNEFGAFLRKHRAEVVDVCITVYDEDKVMAYLREEALAEGREEGHALTYYELIRDGEMTIEHAARRMKCSVEEIKDAMLRLGY